MFIDYVKVFDHVDHSIFVRKLYNFNVQCPTADGVRLLVSTIPPERIQKIVSLVEVLEDELRSGRRHRHEAVDHLEVQSFDLMILYNY